MDTRRRSEVEGRGVGGEKGVEGLDGKVRDRICSMSSTGREGRKEDMVSRKPWGWVNLVEG